MKMETPIYATTSCVICWGPWTNDNPRFKLSCNHAHVHAPCMFKAFISQSDKKFPRCPTCREKITLESVVHLTIGEKLSIAGSNAYEKVNDVYHGITSSVTKVKQTAAGQFAFLKEAFAFAMTELNFTSKCCIICAKSWTAENPSVLLSCDHANAHLPCVLDWSRNRVKAGDQIVCPQCLEPVDIADPIPVAPADK
jgi:hypothetical protein